jgi:hypothetical protein
MKTVKTQDAVGLMQKHADAMARWRNITQDKTYGSQVKNGQIQLVSVTYDAKGKSTVEPCSGWIDADKWLDQMNAWCSQ